MNWLKTAVLVWFGLLALALAAYEYVWVDTNTGVYKPAIVNYDQKVNVQATTGRFDVLWVGGVRITGSSTGTTGTATNGARISGLETDGQVPETLTYRAVPARYSGAAFWYPFDYSSSVILDAAGGGIHAVNRPAGAPMTWADYALTATKVGENYLVQVNSNGVLNGAVAVTFGAWIRPDTALNNDNVLISAGESSNRVAIRMDATNVYAIVSGLTETSTLTYAYGVGLATGVWHRVIASYEKKGVSGTETAEQKLWIDGVRVASNMAVANFFVANNNRFMAMNEDANPGANQFVNGQIDDVFATRTAWDDDAIATDWTDGRSYGINEFLTAKPVSPVNLSPANGATLGTTASQELNWVASSVATNYRVEWGFTASALTSNITSTTPSVSIGQTKSQSNYYWRVAAENAYGAATGAVWQFYAYLWSRLFYTNTAAVWLPARYEGTNVAYDASAIGGLTNWIVESESGGAAPVVEDYAFSFANSNGNKGRIRSPLNTLNYVRMNPTDGAYSFGFWFKMRNPYSMGGPAWQYGQGLAGFGYSSGTGPGSRVHLFRDLSDQIIMRYNVGVHTPTSSIELTLTATISDKTGWNHVQFVAQPFWEGTYGGVSVTGGYYVAMFLNGNVADLEENGTTTRFTFNAGTDVVNFGKVSDYYQELYSYSGMTYFDGWMDDIFFHTTRMTDKGPSATDALELYQRGRSRDY